MGPGVPPSSTRGGEAVARNRYGWEKRAKEIARKQKSDEKMKRRQNRATLEQPEEEPKAQEESSIEE
jgi:hypothetical protein